MKYLVFSFLAVQSAVLVAVVTVIVAVVATVAVVAVVVAVVAVVVAVVTAILAALVAVMLLLFVVSVEFAVALTMICTRALLVLKAAAVTGDTLQCYNILLSL